MRLHKLAEAEHWYKESLRAKPDHIPAHLTYGKLLAMTVSSRVGKQRAGLRRGKLESFWCLEKTQEKQIDCWEESIGSLHRDNQAATQKKKKKTK